MKALSIARRSSSVRYHRENVTSQCKAGKANFRLTCSREPHPHHHPHTLQLYLRLSTTMDMATEGTVQGQTRREGGREAETCHLQCRCEHRLLASLVVGRMANMTFVTSIVHLHWTVLPLDSAGSTGSMPTIFLLGTPDEEGLSRDPLLEKPARTGSARSGVHGATKTVQ